MVNQMKSAVLIAVSLLLIGLGGLIMFSDLYMRDYSTYNHLGTEVVNVEYDFLKYRPTYQYYDVSSQQTVTTVGCWTFDTLQLSIFLVVALVVVIGLFVRNKHET